MLHAVYMLMTDYAEDVRKVQTTPSANRRMKTLHLFAECEHVFRKALKPKNII